MVLNRQTPVKERCGGEHWGVSRPQLPLLLSTPWNLQGYTQVNLCVCVCFPTHFDLPSHHMITDNNALIMQARIKMFPCLNGSCIVILQLYFGAPCINSVDLYIIYCAIKINTRLHDLTSYSFNISLVSQCASEQWDKIAKLIQMILKFEHQTTVTNSYLLDECVLGAPFLSSK